MITCLEMNTRAIGNALFEYATLFGVGHKLGLNIRIPKGENHTHQPTGQKIWQLKEIFNISTPDISQEETDGIEHTYTEKRKQFNSEIFDIEDNTNLIGFFQHEDYFNFCQESLREQLTFGKAWIYQAVRKFSELNINPRSCIAIHVRRGDYTKPHLQPFHPLLPPEYYLLALKELEKYILNDKDISHDRPPKILIFTDDKEYCRKNFTGDSIILVDNDGEAGNILDLCMMSMCGYHIIANSSFSWWGAWLADSKCVVYPHVWFGSGYENYNIVSNKEWIKI